MPKSMSVVAWKVDAQGTNQPCVYESDARRYAYEFVDEVVRSVADRIVADRDATNLLLDVTRQAAEASIGPDRRVRF